MARRPTATATVVAQSEAAPARLRLTRPFGFYDDGIHRHWCAGWIVEDPDDVALLTKRGAAYEILE